MTTPPPPGLTGHELAVWRSLDATVDRFDRHTAGAIERLADRLDVDLDQVPAGTLVDAALALARANNKPGPSAYVGIPVRDLLAELDIDSYPADLLARPGPAGDRCWTAGWADGSGDGFRRDYDTGIDFLCLLPAAHLGRCGWALASVECGDAESMGGAAENYDTGAGEDLVAALAQHPGHTRAELLEWVKVAEATGMVNTTPALARWARLVNS